MQRIPTGPPWLRRALGAALAGMLLLSTVLVLVTIAQAGRILPGTVVVGVDLGGRDEWSARRVLAPELERALQRPLAVSAPGQRLTLRPIEAGLTYDLEATVASARSRGRSGRIQDVAARLTAGSVPVAVSPIATVDEPALVAWIDRAAERLEREASVGSLAIDAAAPTVRVVGPYGAVTVDRAASADRLRAALLDPTISRVELVTTTTAPPSGWAPLEQLADRVRTAIDGPLVLQHEDRQLVVDAAALGALLGITAGSEDGATVPVLTVRAEDVQRLLGQDGREAFDRAAVDARIVTPDLPPVRFSDLSSTTFTPVPVEVEVVPGSSRVLFIPRLTANQLVTMVMDGTRSASADLLIADPALSTEAALSGRPTHLIGTFTTFHPAGTARTINIRLLADLLDDQLIAPGETFSVNLTSGPRRCSEGFVPAGTIIRGELVDTCGGGVSQFGTTLMNAAFFAGVPLDQWQPHSFFISRYPAGREATLSYPELDVRFTNDTDGFLILRTSHTPDSITVALYGAPAWRSVRADHGERRDPTGFDEVVRVAPDLRPGARRVVQSGGSGFTVTVARTRLPLDDGGAPSVERWTTVYRPQQRIVEVGRAPTVVSPDGALGAAGPLAAGAAGTAG